MSNSRSPRAVRSITIGISGIPPHPIGRALAAAALFTGLLQGAPVAGATSTTGWPRDQHLVMDRGPAGRHNVLRGWPRVHNYLLGGYGDDTIYGGAAGESSGRTTTRRDGRPSRRRP